MSNAPSTFDAQHATADEPTTDLATLLRSAGERVRERFQFAGFWSAIVLPMVYVPMLLGGAAAARPTAFVALLAAHAVALVVGRDYRDD